MMALTQVNWTSGGLSADAARAAIRRLPSGGRITVMIHGFRFDPGHPKRSPHRHILSLTPERTCWKAISWPKHLHIDRDPAHLGVAFGWPAAQGLRAVAARAFDVGADLGAFIGDVRHARPDVSIGLIAHSLGARVALSALRAAPAHSVARAVLLSGAEYRAVARETLTQGAGRTACIYNLHSTENLIFDTAFRLAVPAPHLFALPLASGLGAAQSWRNIRFDCPQTRAHLAQQGFRIPAPKTRICHWSAYLRPGLFPLYRRLLDPSLPPIPVQAAAQTARGGVKSALSPL